MHCVDKYVVQGYYPNIHGCREWVDWAIATNLDQGKALKLKFENLINNLDTMATEARLVRRVTTDIVVDGPHAEPLHSDGSASEPKNQGPNSQPKIEVGSYGMRLKTVGYDDEYWNQAV